MLRASSSHGGPDAPARGGHEGDSHADACRRGWEGLIAKRLDSRYAGKRSSDWLKWKCSGEQELVIGGYTAPRGTRDGRLRHPR
jgi:bifunctional non-homologous end joining protein LigD